MRKRETDENEKRGTDENEKRGTEENEKKGRRKTRKRDGGKFSLLRKRDGPYYPNIRVCRKVCVNCHNPFYVKNQKLVIDQN